MGRLENKVALITGTAGGQGRGAALLFASEGAKVFGCDLKVEEAEETVELVRKEGGEMSSLQPLDIGDPEQVERLIAEVVDTYGGIDVLYNNAGVAKFAPIAEMAPEDWHFTIRNELDSVYFVCHYAWPHLVERGGASIINTASTNGMISFSGIGDFAHSATKGGVIAITRSLATEGAPHHIRANSISPGIVDTPASAELLADPKLGPAMLSLHMIQRAGTPTDIAHCALYLASDESGWVTGQNFVIDGGLTTLGRLL